MTSQLQRRQLTSQTLTEIDASSGDIARTYHLGPSSSSDLSPRNFANNTTQSNGRDKYTLQLLETYPTRTLTTSNKPRTSTSIRTDSLFVSLSTLLLTYYDALKTYLSTLFLPTGYPNSVTPDYTPYQIYDSLQAFASSIAGLLSSRAVLQSLNVIDSTSSSTTTATAATLLSIVQSTLSNLTTILFASHAAPRINTEVKFYRFLADIVNDAAFVLDLLAPSLPPSFAFLSGSGESFRWITISIIAASLAFWAFFTSQDGKLFRTDRPRTILVFLGTILILVIYVVLSDDLTTSSLVTTYFPSPRTVVLCLASVLRAMCGVAGGSSKAVLSAHFARNNPENIGDLNAKDGSQETIIGLLGMWFGGIVVSRVEGRVATWLWMTGLLAAHLWCNWMAVRSVCLKGLNRERASLVCEMFWSTPGKGNWKEVIGVDSVSARESILGLWTISRHTRKWRMGVSVHELLRRVNHSTSRQHDGKSEMSNPNEIFADLLHMFRDEPYVVWYDKNSHSAAIVLKTSSRPVDQLKAWFHMSTIQRAGYSSGTDRDYILLATTLAVVRQWWNEMCEDLNKAGWDLDLTNLEEVKGLRLHVDNDK